MEGLSNLSPRRLQKLLCDCRSVKVKRLFLFFADRHQHAWAKRIKKEDIDLGKGKRMLAKGGKLNSTYQITVPEDFVGLQ
jgi:transcriptional regulator with AbiEi antitoxin domain of type IV toxin-antitoxin system